jgi:hypothetical protein
VCDDEETSCAFTHPTSQSSSYNSSCHARLVGNYYTALSGGRRTWRVTAMLLVQGDSVRSDSKRFCAGSLHTYVDGCSRTASIITELLVQVGCSGLCTCIWCSGCLNTCMPTCLRGVMCVLHKLAGCRVCASYSLAYGMFSQQLRQVTNLQPVTLFQLSWCSSYNMLIDAGAPRVECTRPGVDLSLLAGQGG